MRQTGYAIILFIILLMGLGGVGLASLSKDIRADSERQKFLYNQQVLDAAKQALLMYAYRYPETALNFNNTTRGPGRLPCPDTDDPGDLRAGIAAEPGSGSPNPPASCALVGRFPWNANGMDFYEARDASDEHLWYAVTGNFNNQAASVGINTTGSLTLYDQSGGVIYDGSVNSGIAAVIIAPGERINRDNNNDGVYEYAQIRNTEARREDPQNYLDTFFPGAGVAFDNQLFNDGQNNSNDDGIILGPVFDQGLNASVVNDQVVFVTVDEVIEVAQRAVLQSYRDALDDYRTNVGVDVYPWLDDYASVDSLTTLDDYSGEVNTRLGRIPSMFGDYFAAGLDASEAIISDVDVALDSTLVVNGFVVPTGNETMMANATVSFNTAGDLNITPAANGITFSRFYWDEEATPNGWQECLPRTTGTVQDCNQANSSPGVPDASVTPNELETRVVQVNYDGGFLNGVPFTRFLVDAAGPATTVVPPDSTSHAKIFIDYTELANDEVDVDYIYDDFYRNSFDNTESGNLTYRLGVFYYPQLDDWVLADEDGWHDAIQFAFSAGYQPGGVSACGGVNPPCLTVNNSGGILNDKVAVLTLASDLNFIDEGNDGFQNDLVDIFDAENDDPEGDVDQDTYDMRVVNGNDDMLIVR